MDLSRAGIKISNFPAVMGYVLEELDKAEKQKARKFNEKGDSMDEQEPFTYRDVVSAMARLSKRQCQPTHLELSMTHFEQLWNSVPTHEPLSWAPGRLDEHGREIGMSLAGLTVVINDAFACPAVQWRQRETGPYQQELVCQGE